MKKLSLLVLFLGFGLTAMAQIEIGVQVSPTIASNRFIADDKYHMEKESNKLRFGVGVVADYFFSQNYAFSTGLMYRSKGSEIQYNYTSGDGSVIAGKDDIDVQYLELPVSLKLFTNEVAPEVVMYFQVGGSLNTKVAAKVNDKKIIDGERTAKRFNIFETDALIGAGAEMTLGQSTKVFGGLTYHRGLTNIDNYYKKKLGDKNIAVKNNGVSIDVGVKF